MDLDAELSIMPLASEFMKVAQAHMLELKRSMQAIARSCVMSVHLRPCLLCKYSHLCL